jgi:protein gp37
MNRSRIEWTEATWNPVTGCTKVSPACKHCYAERMARRLEAMRQINYTNGFELTIHESVLGLPLSWKRPRLIFVNSMSDLFHERVPTPFLMKVFDVMRLAWWHQFQVLTKRSARLLELSSAIDWSPNVWMGVSVEDARHTYRIEHLRRTAGHVKFLSLEPLLSRLPDLDLEGIDWVIVGGESGPGARPMQEGWVLEIRDQCRRARVPFFFKQWGGLNKKAAGRLLQGRVWDEMPVAIARELRGRPAGKPPLRHRDLPQVGGHQSERKARAPAGPCTAQ